MYVPPNPFYVRHPIITPDAGLVGHFENSLLVWSLLFEVAAKVCDVACNDGTYWAFVKAFLMNSSLAPNVYCDGNRTFGGVANPLHPLEHDVSKWTSEAAVERLRMKKKAAASVVVVVLPPKWPLKSPTLHAN